MWTLFITIICFSLIGKAEAIDASNCNQACSCQSSCNVCQIQNVTILCLQGSKYEMGVNYGTVMKDELAEVLTILKNYYINQLGMTYDYMAELSNYWHYRYSFTYNWFIYGISVGAGIPLQDAKIINSMVIYGLLDEPDTCAGGPNSPGLLGGCAFSYIPPLRSQTGKGFATRNYDFPYPFYQVVKNLVVTILVEPSKAPTAIISMPGQIYCQNCINSYEMFLELNNGGPSAGFCINPYRHGLLISMLEYMQNSGAFFQLDYQFLTTNADVGLIVNAADANQTKSYEFSPYLGQRTMQMSDPTLPYASTNFFQNTTWIGTLPVTDKTCWRGITRRNNILRLIQSKQRHSLQTVKDLWAVPIEQGGAVWNDTLYQLIYDTSTGAVHLRNVKFGGLWVQIPLREIFATVPPSASAINLPMANHVQG